MSMSGKIDNSMRGMIGRSAAGVLAVATGTYNNVQALHAPVLVPKPRKSIRPFR